MKIEDFPVFQFSSFSGTLIRFSIKIDVLALTITIFFVWYCSTQLKHQ